MKINNRVDKYYLWNYGCKNKHKEIQIHVLDFPETI